MKIKAIDFETRRISEEEPCPTPICLSYYYLEDGKERKGIVTGLDSMEAFLFDILSCNCLIVAHNMSFEANVIDTHFPKLRKLMYRKFDLGQMICTEIIEKYIDNTRKTTMRMFSLSTLVMNYFNTDISEDKKNPDAWRLRYHELEDVKLEQWPEEAKRYAIDDSVWTYKIYIRQLESKVDARESIAAGFYLNKIGLAGANIDHERVLELECEINDLIKLPQAYLEKKGILTKLTTGKYKKNLKKFQELIAEQVKEPEKTVKGKIATGVEVLERYIGKVDVESELYAILKEYLNIMEYEKVRTSYIPRLKLAKPLIRSTYKPYITSGRTSCSGTSFYPSVNMQQMPRSVEGVTWDIRNCFVPRPGYKICSIDYNGLELASTANRLYDLTGRQSMLDIVNKGETPIDLHSMLAYRIMNIKEKSKETYEGFMSKKKEKKYAEYRQLAKPINLGFPGGIGYDTMRTLLAKEGIFPKLVVLETVPYEDRISWKRNKAKREGYPVRIRRVGFREFQLVYDELVLLKEELFALYPDLEYFLTEGHNEYLTGETKNIKNEFGEWEKEPMYAYTVGELNVNYCTYTKLCNGILMQSPSAIGAKKAMVKIISKYGNSVAVKPLAFIHDEILFEVLDNNEKYAIIKDISQILIEEMQTVLKSVRIAVEAELFPYWKKSGGEWSKTYFKGPKDTDLKEL